MLLGNNNYVESKLLKCYFDEHNPLTNQLWERILQINYV